MIVKMVVLVQNPNLNVSQSTVAINHNEKLVKLCRNNFKMWQQKIVFYLTTRNLSRFLKDPHVLEDGEDIVEAWKNSDYICQNIILNCLQDSLYPIYVGYETSKKLRDTLDHKYKAEDAGTKKFLVTKFLNFTMVDSKPVVKQAEEFQLLINGILAERMVIEEDNKITAKKLNKEEAEANVIEVKDSKKGKQPKNRLKLGPKGGISKKEKYQGKFFKCGKMGHKSSECRHPKKAKAREANAVE
ncbi:uncharacterized protein LOC120216522 [Hibiscus syriacus]|uniref:uncharacterized protein LOC120216522 n=1 Tax=Hibiscus syriacus TaxID=106335 RepID=UPI001922D808|nr:uncharacterized protein LOC120216522 [Hibiscus syriacus]